MSLLVYSEGGCSRLQKYVIKLYIARFLRFSYLYAQLSTTTYSCIHSASSKKAVGILNCYSVLQASIIAAVGYRLEMLLAVNSNINLLNWTVYKAKF